MSSVNLDPALNSKAGPNAHGEEHGEEDFRMFGFIVFLLSESVIFFSFFV
ncbi:MAG: heme-copper oxidase subunit III, partial [Cyanobacteria bacterium J06588_5]